MTDKIDPTVLRDVERLEKNDPAQYIPVVIQLANPNSGSESLQRRLEAIGAKKIEPLQLANAVAAELTPARVREIAADPAVKRVVSNKPQKVEL